VQSALITAVTASTPNWGNCQWSLTVCSHKQQLMTTDISVWRQSVTKTYQAMHSRDV